MSNLKNKSEINIEAAKKLHDLNFYPSVIHCSYYSCIQLMKHIWIHKMRKSELDLKLINDSTSKGSHEVLINLIKTELVDGRTFNNNIGQLKRLRVDADYMDIQIGYSQSNDSLTLANTILIELKK